MTKSGGRGKIIVFPKSENQKKKKKKKKKKAGVGGCGKMHGFFGYKCSMMTCLSLIVHNLAELYWKGSGVLPQSIFA